LAFHSYPMESDAARAY